MQTKIIICFCLHCLVGDFINCFDEKGTFFPAQPLNNSQDFNSDSESDSSDGDSNKDGIDEMEQYELRENSVIERVQPENFIALYSPPTAYELLHLLKVLDTGIAYEKMIDESNHHINNIGTQFIKC